jgi:hypothetical protein
MPSYESSMLNLAKAKAKWRSPRPWRSNEDSHMIRRYAFLWFTCIDPSRLPGRAWARELGISHTWVHKLFREFKADPNQMWRLQAARGDPQLADLSRARDCTEEMMERGELRTSREANLTKYLRSW